MDRSYGGPHGKLIMWMEVYYISKAEWYPRGGF